MARRRRGDWKGDDNLAEHCPGLLPLARRLPVAIHAGIQGNSVPLINRGSCRCRPWGSLGAGRETRGPSSQIFSRARRCIFRIHSGRHITFRLQNVISKVPETPNVPDLSRTAVLSYSFPSPRSTHPRRPKLI